MHPDQIAETDPQRVAYRMEPSGEEVTYRALVDASRRIASLLRKGSQWPAVVVPLFRGHAHMLTRNLLYTAVSRAQRMLVLVGQPEALGLALGRVDGHRRHTRLVGLVQRRGRTPPLHRRAV